jgi:hypothetical protein
MLHARCMIPREMLSSKGKCWMHILETQIFCNYCTNLQDFTWSWSNLENLLKEQICNPPQATTLCYLLSWLFFFLFPFLYSVVIFSSSSYASSIIFCKMQPRIITRIFLHGRIMTVIMTRAWFVISVHFFGRLDSSVYYMVPFLFFFWQLVFLVSSFDGGKWNISYVHPFLKILITLDIW